MLNCEGCQVGSRDQMTGGSDGSDEAAENLRMLGGGQWNPNARMRQPFFSLLPGGWAGKRAIEQTAVRGQPEERQARFLRQSDPPR
ncbi:MAG: hypothetical protein Kow001_09750 [Acidobacteriota bacterium]